MSKDKLPENLLLSAKVQSFVFIHNASLCETAKMRCEAAISVCCVEMRTISAAPHTPRCTLW